MERTADQDDVPRTTDAGRTSAADNIFIVGIGASAGGLEAIRTLLKAAPREAPAAYVVIQHMAPTQRSMLTELIARETHLECREISAPVRPRRNRVYVGPPGSDVILVDGVLHLVPPGTGIAAPKPSADRFFRSIAEGVAARAVGIVLSGTGSDGAAGVKAIREAGGITFAQDDRTAKYDGMPNAAIETGCIDLVLTPVEMGQRLETLALGAANIADDMKADADQAPLTEILQIVLARTRVDFRDYKPTTILRRLERRMTAVGIASQRDYAAYCRENAAEVDALFGDFLISVTRFFRDPGQYEMLEPLLADRLAKSRDRPVRVWVAGCATGEEAYSVAMLLCEAMGGLQAAMARGLQVFATDIDQNALAIARAGRYPLGALDDVPERYIDSYFEIDAEAGMARMIPALRKMILFSVHNVIQDPPFLHIDLVCCRNLLIYFNAILQDRVFGNFHYALNKDGLVFIGTADNASASADLFAEITIGQKILTRRQGAPVDYARRMRQAPNVRPRSQPAGEQGTVTRSTRPDGAVNALARAMAAAMGEAGLLMTSDLAIVSVFGDPTPYVSLREGKIGQALDHNILADPLAVEVRVLAAMVREDQRTRRGFVRRLPGRETEPVQMEMILLRHADLPEDLYLVVFNRVDEAELETSAPAMTEAGSVQGLQEELALTRDALNRSTERWETANEELKSANEEMQSNNEELQSLNEELETSNEELQSTNEELITVNEAYKVQADELSALNQEFVAILDQSEAPMLVFDSRMTITRASQSAVQLFGMTTAHGGMHVSQLAVPAGFPALAPRCDRALRLGAPVIEECVVEGKLWRLAFTPFADSRGMLQGGTLFATTSDGGSVLLEVLETMPGYLLHQSADGTILHVSRQTADFLGMDREAAVGRNIRDLMDPESAAASRAAVEAFLSGAADADQDLHHRVSRQTGERVTLRVRRRRLRAGPGHADTVLTVGLDITEERERRQQSGPGAS